MNPSMIHTFLQAHKFPLASVSAPSTVICTEEPQEQFSEGQSDKENEEVIPITWIPLDVNPQTGDNITIEQQKSFIWSEKRKQWLWYKNLVIPSIEVKQMKFMQQESEFGYETMKRIVRISCWKLLEDNSFEEVALLGEVYQQLSKQSVILSGLKFGETTFISKSSNFHMVVSIEETQSITGETQIIAAFVSPCVYVEARRKAQKKTKKSLKSGLNSFFQTFKQENEKNEKIQENNAVINGSTQKKELEALHDYLLKNVDGSEQIHPLYLIIKFPSILRLFLNSKNRPAPTSLYENLQTIQSIINKSLQNNQEDNKIQTEMISIYINVSNNRTHKLSKLEEKVIILAQQNGLTLLKNPSNLNHSHSTELILPSSIRNFFLIRLSDQTVKPQSFKKFFDLNIQTLCLQSCNGYKRSALIEDFIKRDLDSNKDKVNTKSTRITKLGETWTHHISSINLNDFPPEPSIVKKIKTEKDFKNNKTESQQEHQQQLSQQAEEQITEPQKSNQQEAQIVCAPKTSPIRLPVKSFSLYQRTGSSLKPTEKQFQINSTSLIPSESLIRSTSIYRPLSNQEVITENEDDHLGRSVPSLSITSPWLDSLVQIPSFSSNSTISQFPQLFQNTYDSTQALTRILLQQNNLTSFDNTNSSANKSQPVFLNPSYQSCPLIPQTVSSTGHQIPLQFYFPLYNN